MAENKEDGVLDREWWDKIYAIADENFMMKGSYSTEGPLSSHM